MRFGVCFAAISKKPFEKAFTPSELRVAETRRASVSGVSVDEELTLLLRHQQNEAWRRALNDAGTLLASNWIRAPLVGIVTQIREHVPDVIGAPLSS